MVFLGEYPSLCVRSMHAVRTQCKHLAYCQEGAGGIKGYWNHLLRTPPPPDRVVVVPPRPCNHPPNVRPAPPMGWEEDCTAKPFHNITM